MATGTFINGDYVQEDRDDGDWVLKDPNGNVIFRRDDTNGEWNFEGETLDNIGAVNAESLQYALNNTGYSDRLSDRPLISDQERTITVGTDTNTIQEAVNEIPLLLRHQYVIEVPDGTYGEDVLIPPIIVADAGGVDPSNGSVEGPSQMPRIIGNESSPGNVAIDSITVTGTQGSIAPLITGFNVVGDTPYDDEPAGVVVYGSQNVSLRHLDFSGCSADIGVIAYASAVTVREGVHFGNDDLNIGMKTKHNAMLHVDGGPPNTFNTGSVVDHVVYNKGGSTVTLAETDTTSGGQVLYNFEGFVDANAAARVNGSSDQTIPNTSTTKLEFDKASGTDQQYNIMGGYDTSTYEFTPPVDGRYKIKSSVEFLSVSSGTQLRVEIVLDGTVISKARKYANGSPEIVTVSDSLALIHENTLYIQVYHNEGTDVDVNLDYAPSNHANYQLLNPHNVGHD